jgi:hypothetical protein
MSSGASAHVVPVPQALPTGVVTTMDFAVPNERPEPMSGVTISAQQVSRSFAHIRRRAGQRLSTARPPPGGGGPLAHLSIESFRLDVDVTAPPGPATLDTIQMLSEQPVIPRARPAARSAGELASPEVDRCLLNELASSLRPELTLRMSRGLLPVERASGLPLELLHEHAHLGGLSQHVLQRQPELAAERAR